MNASGSRAKNTSVPKFPQQKNNRGNSLPTSMPPRDTRIRGNSPLIPRGTSQFVTTTNHSRMLERRRSPQMRSKFTERKPIQNFVLKNIQQTKVRFRLDRSEHADRLDHGDRKVLSSKSAGYVSAGTVRNSINTAHPNNRALSARSNPTHTAIGNNTSSNNNNKNNNNNKSNGAAKVAQQLPARSRPWLRQGASNVTDKEQESTSTEMGIQTNEQEILNRDLLIGDIKFMMASNNITAVIDRKNEEAKKQAMLKASRKFEEHSKKEEEHLTDLKEFLEKGTIVKRQRIPIPVPKPMEVDRRLIKSMDELIGKPVPRAESITDIKERIKRKEKELLNLFDSVHNYSHVGPEKTTNKQLLKKP